MKKQIRYCLIILCLQLLVSCTREVPVVPLSQPVQNLIGNINRTWRLTELYLNGSMQTLTTQQKNYAKTYKLSSGQIDSGTVTNTDGFVGDWVLPSAQLLRETFTLNSQPQQVQIIYTVIEISSSKLDVSYIQNGTLTREVYYAY